MWKIKKNQPLLDPIQSKNVENYFQRPKNKLIIKLSLIIMISLLSQHINLFKYSLTDYNFKLIFYIFLIISLKLCNSYKKHIKYINPVQDFGKKKITNYLRITNIFLIIYLLINIFEIYTNIRIIIISYYFVQKLITRTFLDNKTPFLSLKRDSFQYFKSHLKRNNNKNLRSDLLRFLPSFTLLRRIPNRAFLQKFLIFAFYCLISNFFYLLPIF